MVGVLGVTSASALAQVGKHRVHQRGVGGDLHVDPPGELVLRGDRGDDGVDLLGQARHHRLARRDVPGHLDAGVVGDERLGGVGVQLDQRDGALPGEAGHDAGALGDDPQAVGQAQGAGDDGGGDLAHRVADDGVGVDAVVTARARSGPAAGPSARAGPGRRR